MVSEVLELLVWLSFANYHFPRGESDSIKWQMNFMGSLFCFPHSVRLSFFYLAYFVEVRWKLILESIMVRAFSVHRKSFLKTMKCMFCLSCSTYSICASSLSSCFGVGAYSIFWVTLALNLQLSFVLSAWGSLGERFINNELNQYSTFQGSLKTFHFVLVDILSMLNWYDISL